MNPPEFQAAQADWQVPAGRAPRVYFARAIDGEDLATSRKLTAVVADELAQVGLAMVDPTLSEPPQARSELDRMPRYRAIVDHDLSILQLCDAVLMDMSLPNRNYIGCVCEMTYAYMWRIPCVVNLGLSNQDRPWLHYHATAVFESRESAITRLAELLNYSRD
jgi:hypothetical protein